MGKRRKGGYFFPRIARITRMSRVATPFLSVLSVLSVVKNLRSVPLVCFLRCCYHFREPGYGWPGHVVTDEPMRIPRLLALAQALTLPLLFLPGCKPSPVSLTPVQGKVTYKGTPLKGGAIVFTPDTTKGQSGKIAHGKIGADGAYQLLTGEAKGAAPGRYRVTVVSLAHTNAPEKSDRFLPPPNLLPEKYRDPNLSELVCEIKENKNNVLDFDLN
jgi:hypothetical protein